MIGLNGEERRTRIENFVNKCLNSNQKLYISLLTKKEFEGTIDSIIRAITTVGTKGVSLSLYEVFQDDSFINYYNKWSSNRVNSDCKMFKAHLRSQFEMIQSKYRINIDYETRGVENEKNQERLQFYKCSLLKFAPNKRDKAADYDVKNIQIIEKIRGRENKNLYGVSAYFITTDHKLCSWDISRKGNYPIALLPSCWYALLLRIDGRGQVEDYKSFISFINLNHNNEIIPIEKQTEIIQGISEIASNEADIKYILEEMLMNHQNYNLSDITEDEIKKEGESILSKRINQLNQRLNDYTIKEKENKKQMNELTVFVQDMQRASNADKKEIEVLKEGEKDSKEETEKYKCLAVTLFLAFVWGIAYYVVEKTYNISPLNNDLFKIFTTVVGVICGVPFTVFIKKIFSIKS